MALRSGPMSASLHTARKLPEAMAVSPFTFDGPLSISTITTFSPITGDTSAPVESTPRRRRYTLIDPSPLRSRGPRASRSGQLFVEPEIGTPTPSPPSPRRRLFIDNDISAPASPSSTASIHSHRLFDFSDLRPLNSPHPARSPPQLTGRTSAQGPEVERSGRSKPKQVLRSNDAGSAFPNRDMQSIRRTDEVDELNHANATIWAQRELRHPSLPTTTCVSIRCIDTETLTGRNAAAKLARRASHTAVDKAWASAKRAELLQYEAQSQSTTTQTLLERFFDRVEGPPEALRSDRGEPSLPRATANVNGSAQSHPSRLHTTGDISSIQQSPPFFSFSPDVASALVDHYSTHRPQADQHSSESGRPLTISAEKGTKKKRSMKRTHAMRYLPTNNVHIRDAAETDATVEKMLGSPHQIASSSDALIQKAAGGAAWLGERTVRKRTAKTQGHIETVQCDGCLSTRKIKASKNDSLPLPVGKDGLEEKVPRERKRRKKSRRMDVVPEAQDQKALGERLHAESEGLALLTGAPSIASDAAIGPRDKRQRKKSRARPRENVGDPSWQLLEQLQSVSQTSTMEPRDGTATDCSHATHRAAPMKFVSVEDTRASSSRARASNDRQESSRADLPTQSTVSHVKRRPRPMATNEGKSPDDMARSSQLTPFLPATRTARGAGARKEANKRSSAQVSQPSHDADVPSGIIDKAAAIAGDHGEWTTFAVSSARGGRVPTLDDDSNSSYGEQTTGQNYSDDGLPTPSRTLRSSTSPGDFWALQKQTTRRRKTRAYKKPRLHMANVDEGLEGWNVRGQHRSKVPSHEKSLESRMHLLSQE